uniref:Uncharacterized protein n=1 Tax=Aplanochytrium stocchinoi TaxID=215587 RepID=A0A6S8CDX2_9STRA|mmetsp:Transcript_9436/g.12273  ORF Transcript_9436/g.12273 Transcript_9436/m.12273 type:complete len:187 (-) Transcript_9436:1687-2247(-)
MSRIDNVEKGLTEVANKAHAMKVRAQQVANSVPPPLYTQDAQWPALLGQFRLLSNQARDLDNVIVDVFKDYVISPTETGHGPNGEPTTLLPDMLRSRKPPDQEQSELDVINRVSEQEAKRLKMNKNRDRGFANANAREKMIKDNVYKYDSALRSAYGSFLAEERLVFVSSLCVRITAQTINSDISI